MVKHIEDVYSDIAPAESENVPVAVTRRAVHNEEGERDGAGDMRDDGCVAFESAVVSLNDWTNTALPSWR